MDDPQDLMCGFPQPEPVQGCYGWPEIDRGGDGRIAGDDWYGDNVPAGVFNAKLSPWVKTPPPQMGAMGTGMMQAQALRTDPVVRYEFREELVLPPKRP